MKENCENCKFSRRLKHNFQIINGYEESYCCVAWEYNDVDDNTDSRFVIEVTPFATCEMFKSKWN